MNTYTSQRMSVGLKIISGLVVLLCTSTQFHILCELVTFTAKNSVSWPTFFPSFSLTLTKHIRFVFPLNCSVTVQRMIRQFLLLIARFLFAHIFANSRHGIFTVTINYNLPDGAFTSSRIYMSFLRRI